MGTRKKIKYGFREKIFRSCTIIAASFIPLIILLIGVVIFKESSLAYKRFGWWEFLVSTNWDPARESFGALPALCGTVIITFLSLLMSLPLSIGIAIFVAEIAPPFLKGAVATAIDLLAAIPSVVYGMWGLFTISPIMRNHIEPAISTLFAPLPLLGFIFTGTPTGVDILTASLILSIMLIPYVASVSREAILMTPEVIKESAYSLGATKWEVIKDIVLPYAKAGITGGILLSLGRAMGETMAVAFVLGNNHRLPRSLFDATSTITVTLANEFTEADTDIYLSSLFFLALILYAISLISITVAKFLIFREKKIGH